MRARWLVILFVVPGGVLPMAAPRAFAQSASVQAQSLFDEGRKLVKAGKIAEACAAFESSQKLDPAVTTLLNLADCREQNHQLATAWGAFVDANRLARASNNAKLAQVASNHARKLESRLSKLTINVPADRQVPGLEILRNTEPINPAGWNHALPIDGGTYTITARAPGRAPWSTTRTIKVESDAQVVEIPKLTEAKPGAPVAAARTGTQATPGPTPPPARPAAPPASPSTGKPADSPPTASPSKPAAPPVTVSTGKPADSPPTASSAKPAASAPTASLAKPPGAQVATAGDSGQSDPVPPSSLPSTDDQPSSGRSRMLPLTLGAGALVLGGAALGFHLWGDSLYDQADKEMTSQDRRDELEHSANTRRYLAQGFGVAALGCAGAAVYLYVRGRGEHHADATAVTPVASPQFAGLAVAGRW